VGEYLERMARYDLLLGVTSPEAFVLFNNEEMELGLETEGINNISSPSERNILSNSDLIH
jgi:hypothetical protein